MTQHVQENFEFPCRHYGVCGGCTLQHLDTQDYIDEKTSLIANAFHGEGLKNIRINPPILIPKMHRRRCNFKVMRLHDVIHLGYHTKKSHDIADITECPLILPELEALIIPLKKLFIHLLRNKQKVDVFLLHSDTGTDILVEGLWGLSLEQSNKIISFCEQHQVSRFNLKRKNEKELIIEFQKPTIRYGNIPVECQADGFTQASKMADEILTNLVLREWPQENKRTLDLFCGRGTFSIPLSQHAKVDAFELDAQAIKDLEKAKNKASCPIQLSTRNLFEDPLILKELNAYDFAILNPPRAGAKNQCYWLSQSSIPVIVMVSCEPATFARDARLLIQGGYNIEEVTPVDQFLWSRHVEVVGCFRKA
ncbi:MAG: class I SAM-dependent RNA methyltransferase [Alphaproteobacteria bacterium]|nr:class I SAM-dependent RNA methyltransferase [Alphaproteobacteria bacterium]